jgi:metal-responsive CopG/Arc/MetJ family transcriptional regulator
MTTEQKKLTVTLPQALLERLNQAIPNRQRSLFVTQAIEEHLNLIEQITVLEESAGSWSLENHPDMLDDQGIDTWLKASRQDWH